MCKIVLKLLHYEDYYYSMKIHFVARPVMMCIVDNIHKIIFSSKYARILLTWSFHAYLYYIGGELYSSFSDS